MERYKPDRAIGIFLLLGLFYVFPNIWHFLSSITPSKDFISDIAAVEAVLIGIAIPLSFEIISRLSERYQSDAIIGQFNKERVIKLLYPFLIVNVIITVTVRLMSDDISRQYIGAWKILSWLLLVFFIIGMLLFLMFIRLLANYTSGTGYVTDRLYRSAESILNE